MSVFGGAGVTSAGVAARLHPGYPAASFAYMMKRPQIVTLSTADNLRLYWHPIVSPITVSTIWLNTQTGGAGSAVKCAVWANNPATARPTGLPLLGQNAGFDTTASGIDSAAIANVRLPAGGYWFGEVHTGTAPQCLGISATDVTTPDIMMGSAAAPQSGWVVAQTYANDIMALDLTLAGFSATNAPIAGLGLGWV